MSASLRTAAFAFGALVQTQQIQLNRTLGSGNNFVAYVDATGELDGTPCVLEWKTTSARYPEEPAGISALDPQLVCYSWMTGIDEVAQIVFVRKRLVEVQYLRAAISAEQRQEFATLVDDTILGCATGKVLDASPPAASRATQAIDWRPYFAVDTRSVIDGEPLSRTGHESLTLVFCWQPGTA